MKNILVVEKEKELKDIILTNGKLNISTLILGKIGVGKSQIVKSLHKEYGGYFEDIRVSTMDRTDLRGLFSIENGMTKWHIPERLAKFFKPDARGILFFDEINLADIDIQSALYQIILDRELEGLKMGKDVIIVCAGNTMDEVPMVKPMSPALMSRFSIIYYDPSNSCILEYLESIYRGKSKIADSILDYYNIFKTEITENIKPEDEEYIMFTRPRNIENVLKLAVNIKEEEYKRDKKKIYNFIAAITGVSAANKICEFLNKIYTNEHEKYKIENYITGKMSIKNVDESEKYIIMLAAAEYVASRYEENNKNIKETCQLVDEIYEKVIKDLYKDYQVVFGRQILLKIGKEDGSKILTRTKLMKIYANMLIESSEI